MADFEKIWQFIERKMGVAVPPYIKYVLRYCGFENCHTISEIVEADLAYMESHVQKGGIVEHFRGEVPEAEILKGCMTDVKEFEIIRGHRKLIMVAVKLVKEYLEENGVEVFSAVSPKRKNKPKYVAKSKILGKTEKSTEGKVSAPRKKTKFSPVELLSESMLESIDEKLTEEIDPSADPNIRRHKYNLLVSGLAHLKGHNSLLYDEAKINEKFTDASIEVSKKSPGSLQYTSTLKCPFCEDPIIVFHKVSTSELGSWNTFNFGRHLMAVHLDIYVPCEKVENVSTKVKSKKKIGDMVQGAALLKQSAEAQSEREAQFDSKIENIVVDCEDDINVVEQLEVLSNQFEFIDGAAGFSKLKDEHGHTKAEACTVLATSDKKGDICILDFPIDVPLLMPVAETSDVSLTQNQKNEADENCTLIIVPTMNANNDGMELEVSGKDHSMNGLDNSGDLSSDISGYAGAHSRIGEKLIFRNGGYTSDGSWEEKTLIHTRNTCGFDSILEIYAALYFDHQNYREFLDVANLLFRSEFTTLVHEYFQVTSSTPKLQVTHIHSAWESLNLKRNIILKNVFSSQYYEKLGNLKKENRFVYIDCETGMGEFFSELASGNLMLSSAVETKTCYSCQATTTKIVPFLALDGINLELGNIQQSIDQHAEKIKFCTKCKGDITFTRVFNQMVVIHVEPSRDVHNKKKVSLQHLSRSIKLQPDNEYKLCGVIEYNPLIRHFTALFDRINDGWVTFDDLKISETKHDEKSEFLPFMLFYSTDNKGNGFKKAFIEKMSSTELNTYDSDNKNSTGRLEKVVEVGTITSMANKIILSSTSSTSSAEWKKKRENGWRY